MNDWKTMKDEYNHLSTDVNKTLDAVLKVIGRNGNNGGGK